MFDTFGPYNCSTSDPAELHHLLEQFRASEPANVEDGVGIYIVSVEDPKGNLTPWYVGQTYKSFGGRLGQHFKKKRFEELFSKGTLSLLLIARATNGRIITAQTGSRGKLDRKLLDWLEVDLIDKCRVINPELLNRQFVKFLTGIWVGGYRGDQACTVEALNSYKAYRHLARVLKLDSGRN